MNPGFFKPIDEPAAEAPKLLMVVDTEEEFDWSKPLARENVAVTAIPELRRLQEVVRQYGLAPTYVVDYPVAATTSSSRFLAELADAGECRIGAHLHPWVTPPFEEPLAPEMSFGCNLAPAVERRKIATLKETIAREIGVAPEVYKAGRYGLGVSTVETLEALGFSIDASVIPHFDFTSEQGPSFAGFSPFPGLFGRQRAMLELPCTAGFVGVARRFGDPLRRIMSSRLLNSLRANGIMSRTGVLNRVLLSPEGYSFEEMRALTETLYADGLRTFVMTLHSPSLKPGCTIYVRSSAERDAFLSTIDRYCDFLFCELGGRPATGDELYRRFGFGEPADLAS